MGRNVTYENFKEKQFRAYKKTKEYRKQVEEFRKHDRLPENLDSFLRSYIVNYTAEFLDDEEEEESSNSEKN